MGSYGCTHYIHWSLKLNALPPVCHHCTWICYQSTLCYSVVFFCMHPHNIQCNDSNSGNQAACFLNICLCMSMSDEPFNYLWILMSHAMLKPLITVVVPDFFLPGHASDFVIELLTKFITLKVVICWFVELRFVHVI